MATRAQQPRRRPRAAVDGIDLAILRVLRDDGRISIAALADAVGVSRANAYARLERLRAEGVIEGFSARINHARVGLGVSAVCLVQVRQPAREELSKALQDIAGIEYAAFVTGEQDVMVVMRAPDVETLRDEMMAPLSREPRVRSLHTILVLDEVVSRPFVVPQEGWLE